MVASGGLAGATGTFQLQSTQGSRTADQALLKNATGDVVAEGYNNDRYEGTFEWVPTAVSAASLATTYILPKPGSAIAITEAISGNSFIGAAPWIADSVDWRGDLSSPRTITIKVHRYEHSDISADAA